MRPIIVFILFSLFFVTCQTKNAKLIPIQSTELTLNLEQGKTYKQKSTIKTSVSQDFNGQKIDLDMTIRGSMSFFVKSITPMGYSMDVKFEELGMLMQMPQGTIEFDSEKVDTDNIFSMVCGAMKNKAFEVTLNKQGKVTDIKNVEKLFEAAIDQFAEIPEAQKKQIRSQLKQAYGSEAMKGSIEMVTAIYPEKPVYKGDNWTINTNLQSTIPMQVSTAYEFVNVTPDFAFIKGTSSIKTTNPEAYIDSYGMLIKYDLTGSMLSEIKVDKNTGWIIEATINQEVIGNTYIKESAQTPDELKIPMLVLNETVITNN